MDRLGMDLYIYNTLDVFNYNLHISNYFFVWFHL